MKLFEWVEIENLGDLVRLDLVLEAMPDEKLIKALEKSRGKGRNDYPVRAMWNSVLTGKPASAFAANLLIINKPGGA
jgi:hypothetical protein